MLALKMKRTYGVNYIFWSVHGISLHREQLLALGDSFVTEFALSELPYYLIPWLLYKNIKFKRIKKEQQFRIAYDIIWALL